MAVFNWGRPGHELVTTKFEWNVKVPFLQSRDGRGGSSESPHFSQQETPGTKWQLELFDKKTKIRIRTYHCSYDEGDVDIVDSVLVKMSILKRNGLKVFQQMLPFTSGCYVEFKLSKDEINLSECQQENGNLIFCFKIFSHLEKDIGAAAVPNAVDCSGELSTHLEHLFDSMKFSDVIFKIGDREFAAHKSILVTRSEYFEAMFKHPTKENLSGQIEIEDIEPDVFEKLLRFIYTGRLGKATMEILAARLFITADKYLMNGLKSVCGNYLLHHMSADNCVVLLAHGDLLNPAEYMKKSAKFFRRFQQEVMATEGWKKLKKENPTLLCYIHEFLLNCHK